MLNRAVGGAYGFTTDIGGYFDVYNGTPTTKELFLRWAQLAALTPFFRLHGSLIAGVHTPWSFDAQTVRLYNALSRLHDRARPLILRLWREAVRTGIPPTRPLWLAYPGDARAPRDRTRSGCWGATSSWRPSSARERAGGRSTSRAAAGASRSPA